jgi:hypothetical protein
MAETKPKTKIITFYSTLLHKARELGQAKLSGDPERIAKAQKAHDEYAELCKHPDVQMQVDLRPFPN